MGNYSSKIFNKSNANEAKDNEHIQPPELRITPEQVSQNGEVPDSPSNDDEIMQTPIKKNCTLESRKRTNAIPEYLLTDKTRKPYLETDLDSVTTTGKFWLDPRSPNVAYPRTPILFQNNLDPLTKNANGENLPKLRLPHAQLLNNGTDLDPRSPAVDFDRTPISAVKISKQLNSQCQDNVNSLRKSNSSLDICIKLSYCETTSLFNIPEIQALPDIVVSLRRSCSMKDNLNENTPSQTTDGTNIKSELVSDDLPSVKLRVSRERSVPNLQVESETVNDPEMKNDETEIEEKHVDINSTNATSEKNIDPPKDTVSQNKANDQEEKFKVWRDSYSKLPENPNNSRKNALLPEKEEIMIEFDDGSITNSARNNQAKKVDKNEGSTKENKVKAVEKKNLETKKENKFVDEKKLFSPEFKTAAEFSKSRTPFSNRSNNNGQIQALSAKSPQQFLINRKLFISDNKNLQENTPPTHKKRVKNVPAKLNGTQWDTETTIII